MLVFLTEEAFRVTIKYRKGKGGEERDGGVSVVF